MKKIVVALIIFTFHFSLFNSAMAQGVPAPQRHTVNFESRNYETFTVFVDGTVQNRMPQSRVMVNDVSSQTHEVVVVLKSPEQKAAVLQLLPGEPVVTVYVDYDSRLERMTLYTPSYNLAEKERVEVMGFKEAVAAKGSERTNDGLVGADTTAEGPKVVTEEDLVGMLLRMKGQPFDSDRLALGKVIVASSHLTAMQIARLAETIDFSNSQVGFLDELLQILTKVFLSQHFFFGSAI